MKLEYVKGDLNCSPYLRKPLKKYTLMPKLSTKCSLPTINVDKSMYSHNLDVADGTYSTWSKT